MFPNSQVIVYVNVDDSIKYEMDRLKQIIDNFKEKFDIGIPNAIYLPTFYGDTHVEVISY